jgi:hypothetical protein
MVTCRLIHDARRLGVMGNSNVLHTSLSTARSPKHNFDTKKDIFT